MDFQKMLDLLGVESADVKLHMAACERAPMLDLELLLGEDDADIDRTLSMNNSTPEGILEAIY